MAKQLVKLLFCYFSMNIKSWPKKSGKLKSYLCFKLNLPFLITQVPYDIKDYTLLWTSITVLQAYSLKGRLIRYPLNWIFRKHPCPDPLQPQTPTWMIVIILSTGQSLFYQMCDYFITGWLAAVFYEIIRPISWSEQQIESQARQDRQNSCVR